VTINDVAEHANVSKATVSHVINNTRFVADETRSRVMQVITDLGYQPSMVARSLTTNRTGTIGIIVSDVANNFFGDVLKGIEDIFRPYSISLMVCNTDEILEREDHYIDLLLGQRVDGIIAAATSQKWDVLGKAESLHTPLVVVDRAYEGLAGPYVGVKNAEGARMGVRHLIEAGYRSIGILAGFQRLSTMRERLSGFRQGLDENGIALPEAWCIPSPLSIEAGREAALKLLRLPDRPRAIFINNNLLSLGTLQAVQELGLSCPQDVALIGFDDPPWAAVSCPPLTVIRQPSRQVGRVAAQVLLDLMDGQAPAESHLQLDCELVLRRSCCPAHP
jgi:LacI family transcriptional regulator